MRRVLLTDFLPDVLDELTYTLGNHFQLQTCCNGNQISDLIDSFQPEILLLDVSMPGFDRERLLHKLQTKNIPVIVSALHYNDYLVRMLDNFGVLWLMVKPMDANAVAAHLLELELALDGTDHQRLRIAVYTQLLQMGVRLRYQGFEQVAQAVLFACNNEDYSVKEQLYPHVAQVCGSTNTAVEKAIRRCVEQAFAHRNRFVWTSIFGNSAKEKIPTNSHFISHVAHAAKNQLQ